MSVRDIQFEMEELYGIDVSPAMISKITDKVVEAAAEWQSRELDKYIQSYRQLRKYTKVRTVFPTDESLRKSLYLSTMKIMEKWTSPNQNWASTLGQLTIMFGERIPNSYTI